MCGIDSTLTGLWMNWALSPRVAPRHWAQPWAEGLNPFGIRYAWGIGCAEACCARRAHPAIDKTIPTGLDHSARGWPRRRATPGRRIVIETNPERVKSRSDSIVIQPLQGSGNFGLHLPKVAPRYAVQPWAEGLNPFGIRPPSGIGCAGARQAHPPIDQTIPTGLNHSARGWPRQRTTPGNRTGNTTNPERVGSGSGPKVIQPLQGCGDFGLHLPKVAPRYAVQPWADRSNPFGIRHRCCIGCFQGCNSFLPHLPRVARSAQPWAERFNPLGIVLTCRRRVFVCVIGLFVCLRALLSSSLPAAEASLVETDTRTHAVVQPVRMGDARWTTGFWADRFELCRTQTIPALERIMAGTNYSHFIRNFEIAAGLAEGRHRGAPFNDGEVYKWIEAAAATLAVVPDPDLEKRLDEIIALIARAQHPDGYIHTPVLIRQRQGDTNALPFADRNNFELYNLGHLMLAGCVHYRVTGKTNLLTIARKAADYLCTAFEQVTPEGARGSVCPSHFMGLIELCRVTGNTRYLALARKLFDLRFQVANGSDENQDRLPFEHQTEPVGHAVRANYLYAGATDLFIETGDELLWRPLPTIWSNLVQKKMYVTGGCGALYDGASPDAAKDQKSISRVHQAYGRNYQLPNITAHNETCANIGNVLWNWRMFLATGDARFMDIVELTLYNSVLSGVSLDGTNFFYTNPLRVTEPMPVELRWPRVRVPFLGSFCCPPNLARTLAHSPEFAYAKSDGAIWVNLYGSSELATELAGVGKIRLAQETEYPWNGRVRIKIHECGTNEFGLKLRIPGWAKAPIRLRLNHRPVELALRPGSYAELRRVWHAGDFVDLDIPMHAELIEANPLVEETLNQVAIKRGPIVYCLESADLPDGVHVTDVIVPADIELRARYDSRLLGGVVVLDATLLAKPAGDWTGRLYREFSPPTLRPVNTKLIPYALWGNRGRGEMTVWMPVAHARP